MNRGFATVAGGGLPLPTTAVSLGDRTGKTSNIDWNLSSVYTVTVTSGSGLTFKFLPIASKYGPQRVSLIVTNTSGVNAGMTWASSNIKTTSPTTRIVSAMSPTTTAVLNFLWDGTSYYYIDGWFSDGSQTGTTGSNTFLGQVVAGSNQADSQISGLLQAVGQGTFGSISASTYSASPGPPLLELFKAHQNTINGTTLTAATVSGEVLGRIDFMGVGNYNSTYHYSGIGASIQGVQTAAVTTVGSSQSAQPPTRIEFRTNDSSINSSTQLRTSILDTGQVIVGSTTTAQTINGINSSVQVQGTGGDTSSVMVGSWNAATAGPTLEFMKSRNATIGSNTALVSGDSLATFDFSGVNTAPARVNTASQIMAVDGSPGATFIPSRFEWWVGTASAAPARAVTILNTGTLSVGNTTTALTLATTTAALQVNQTSSSTAGAIFSNWAADANSAPLIFQKSRGTAVGTYTATNHLDVIGELNFYGVNSSSASTLMGQWFMRQSGAAGTTNNKAWFEWHVGDTTNPGSTYIMNLSSTGLSVGGSSAIFAGTSLDSYGANSDVSALGSELTTNGTFTGNATGWTLNTGWAYSSNTVVCTTSTGGLGTMTQNISVTSGVVYLVQWDQTHSIASDSQITVSIGAVNGMVIKFADTVVHTTGQLITAGATGSLALTFTPTAGSGTITIDNVTVKAVTPATNSSPAGWYDSAGALIGSARGTVALSNLAFGRLTFANNNSGQANVAFGTQTLNALVTANSSTAFGYQALANLAIGDGNTAVGRGALVVNVSGPSNTAIGYQALVSLINGASNTSVGFGGMNALTYGSHNASLGVNSGSGVTTGSKNTFLGRDAGANVTTGDQNVSIGYLTQVASATNSGQLSIQNIIYGFGNTSTGGTVSSGTIVIGAATDDATNTLQVNHSTAVYQYSADAVGAVQTFAKSRNATYGSNTGVSSSDVIGKVLFRASNTSPAMVDTAYMQVVAQGGANSTVIPSQFQWYTSTSSGAPVNNMVLDANGNLFLPNPITSTLIIGSTTSLSYGFSIGSQINSTTSTNAGSLGLGIWGTSGPVLKLQLSRGALGVASTTSSGDLLGQIRFGGVDTGNNYREGVRLDAYQDGAAGSLIVPGRLEIATTGSNGVTRMALAVNGDATMTQLGQGTGGLIPAAPASGNSKIYTESVANRQMMAMVDPSGSSHSHQPHFGRAFIQAFAPTPGAATITWEGAQPTLTVVGTATARTPATTRYMTRAGRLGFVSAATAGSLTSWYTSAAASQWFTLGNGTSQGGFHYILRWGISDAATVAGARQFMGLSSAIAAPTNVAPTTLTNCIGMGCDIGIGNNMKIYYGGSAAQTSIDLGANFPANTLSTDWYEFSLFAPVNLNNTVYYSVKRLNSLATAPATGTLSGTAGTALPANTTFLAPVMWRTNNATALAVAFDVGSLYIESINT